MYTQSADSVHDFVPRGQEEGKMRLWEKGFLAITELVTQVFISMPLKIPWFLWKNCSVVPIGDKAINVLREGLYDLGRMKWEKRGIVDFAPQSFLPWPYEGPLDLSTLSLLGRGGQFQELSLRS